MLRLALMLYRKLSKLKILRRIQIVKVYIGTIKTYNLEKINNLFK